MVSSEVQLKLMNKMFDAKSMDSEHCECECRV